MAGYDRRIRTLDLMSRDYYVLQRMLHLLCTILHQSRNSIQIQQMSKCLLEFMQNIRTHHEATIRRACAYCIQSVAVSAFSLVDENLCELVVDSRQWLYDVIRDDDDNDVKRIAMSAIAVIDQQVRKQMTGPT